MKRQSKRLIKFLINYKKVPILFQSPSQQRFGVVGRQESSNITEKLKELSLR